MGRDILIVKLASLNLALLVIIGSLQDRPTPFSQQSLRHALDAWLGLLAPRVKEHDFTNTTTQKCLFLNVQSCECRKNITLDIVCRQRPIVKGFQEELDVLQEVGIGVKYCMLNIIPVEDARHLWKKFQLMQSRLASLTSTVVSLAGSFHLKFQIGQLLVDFIFEILAQ